VATIMVVLGAAWKLLLVARKEITGHYRVVKGAA